MLSFFRKKNKEKKSGSGAEYFQLLVKDVINETAEAISIIFENPDKKIKYKPGQFLSLVFRVDGEEVRRSYSLSTSPFFDEDLGVTVKRIDQGKISNYINEKIRPGDMIEAMEPKGNFTIDIDPEEKRNLFLFAGGSGITPLYSIGKSVLHQEPHSNVMLVYQNRNEDSIIYKEAIDRFRSEYPNFKVVHILSQPGPAWNGRKGRITKEDVRDLVSEALKDNEHTPLFYVCGPHGMMETVMDQLLEMNVPHSSIHKESYVAASTKAASHKETPPPVEEVVNHEVTIILNGEEYKITVEPGRYILETALDADLNMPFSCQSGLCTACRGKLISGKVQMDDPDGLSEEEIAEGYVLTCVSHPVTNDVVIEIG